MVLRSCRGLCILLKRTFQKSVQITGTRLLQPQELLGLPPSFPGNGWGTQIKQRRKCCLAGAPHSMAPHALGCSSLVLGSPGGSCRPRRCAGWRNSGGHLFLTPSPRKLCPADSKQLTFEERDKMQLNGERRSRVSRPHTSGVSLRSFLTQSQVEPK